MIDSVHICIGGICTTGSPNQEANFTEIFIFIIDTIFCILNMY